MVAPIRLRDPRTARDRQLLIALAAWLAGCVGPELPDDREVPDAAPHAPLADGPDADAGLPPGPWGYASDLNNSVHGGFGERDGRVARAAISLIPGDSLPIYVEPAPPRLDDRAWRAEVAAACNAWRMAGARPFVRVARRQDARVVIGFRDADHDDDCDIGYSDPETTLAHAFEYAHACLAGEIHLNAGLTWVLNGAARDGVYDVRTVVMHELGHLLGLGHVEAPGHIMSPAYGGPRRNLTADEERSLAERHATDDPAERE